MRNTAIRDRSFMASHVKCRHLALAADAAGAALVFRRPRPGAERNRSDAKVRNSVASPAQIRTAARLVACPGFAFRPRFPCRRRCGRPRRAAAADRPRQPRRAPARIGPAHAARRRFRPAGASPSPTGKRCPTTVFSPHPDIVSQRLATLHRLPTLKRGIVIVPVPDAAAAAGAARNMSCGSSFDVKVGQRLDLDAKKRRLESGRLSPRTAGARSGRLRRARRAARRVPDGRGPCRSAWNCSTTRSRRSARSIPTSQRSLEKIDAVHLLPGREVPLDDAALKRALACAARPLRPGHAPQCALPGPQGRARAARHRVLPAAVLRRDRDAVRLPGAGRAAGDRRRCDGARPEQFWHEHRRALRTACSTTSNARCCRPTRCILRPNALRERLNEGARVASLRRGPCASASARSPWATSRRLRCRSPRAITLPADALKSFLGSYPGRVLIAPDSRRPPRERCWNCCTRAALKPQALADWPSFASGDDRLRDRRARRSRTASP